MDERATHAAGARSLAAALVDSGRPGFHASVTGAPRGPVCGMGTCFECRATVGGRENVRTCLEDAALLSAVADAAGAPPAMRDDDRSGAPAIARERVPARSPVLARSPEPARSPVPARTLHARACDVLVVGAGPAGLAAACAAAERGRRVLLVDENPGSGGQIWRADSSARPARWRERARALGVEQLPSSSVALVTGERSVRVAAADEDFDVTYGAAVLATGATELFLPFPGWTLPNVFGLGGLQALAKCGLDVAGKRIVLAGSGPLLLAVAAGLARRGARVVRIAEQAPLARVAAFGAALLASPARLLQGAALRAAAWRSAYATGCWPARAEGQDCLRRFVLQDGRSEIAIDCDHAGVGFGLVPNSRLGALLGCALDGRRLVVDAAQRTSVPGVYAAGECTGIGGALKAVIEGEVAGAAAAGDPTAAARLARRLARERAFAARLARDFALRPELRRMSAGDTLVCRCEDVARAPIEACSSWREAKLHTRCGMGPCQGRVCGPAVEFLAGFAAEDARPPVGQVPVGALVGPADRVTMQGAQGARSTGGPER